MARPVPTAIRRLENKSIEVEWSDGASGTITPRVLRDSCPCASCREKRVVPPDDSSLKILKAEETVALTIKAMKPVGQYAYKIEFSDRHDSGIYTLDFLRELIVLQPRQHS